MTPNMIRNILYSEIYHLTNFDVLIQSGFKVIQKRYLLIYAKYIMMIS